MYFHSWLAISASAWAMFKSANSRACCHRSRPLPLTISRVVKLQFEPPPGQKRAMSLSSESGMAPRVSASPSSFTSLYSRA